MHTLMKKIKSGKDVPGIKTVPSGFVLSLISLGFGGALGPEAALIGIAVAISAWAVRVMEKFSEKTKLFDLKKPWSKIPGYMAIATGLVVFALISKPLFTTSYPYYPYKYEKLSGDMVAAILFGFIGILVGNSFSMLEKGINNILNPFRKHPIRNRLLGGVLLGVFGAISPLVLFSGQTGLKHLLSKVWRLGVYFLSWLEY
jgi:H+/Cl- antiporter ClcA